jgi:hypothetical protein
MSFGRNPHVAKAQAAEQKAVDAPDESSRTRAYRDAAHAWERAAEKERPGKQRDEYVENAQRNRSIADGDPPVEDDLSQKSDDPAKSDGSVHDAPIDPLSIH